MPEPATPTPPTPPPRATPPPPSGPPRKDPRRFNSVQKLLLLAADILSQVQGKKILDARRRRASQLVTLGVACTLIVFILDLFGALRNVENFFYDERIYRFQYNLPKPSDSVVHLDIDDGSVEIIGRWPWSRDIQARILDELTRYEPKIVFLDIIQDKPQIESIAPGSIASTQPSSADQSYADMLGRSGRTLLPVSANLDMRAAPTPLQVRMIAELMRDLATTPGDLAKRLVGAGFEGSQVETEVDKSFAAARERAADSILLGEIQANPDVNLAELRKKYFPSVARSVRTTAALEVLQIRLDALLRDRRVQTFGLEIPAGLPEALKPNYSASPLLLFSNAAKYSGFVDFVRIYEGDSVVRYIPLFINFNGRLLPHVSLQMACTYLGIRVEDLRITPNSITIPGDKAGGRPECVIPVRTLQRGEGSSRQDVPFVVDIPWFGGRQWLTMYDVPKHREIRQHVSTVKLWNILEAEEKITNNVENMRNALVAALNIINDPASRDMMATLTFNSNDEASQGYLEFWTALIEPALAELEAQPEKTTDELNYIEDLGKLDEIRKSANRQREDLVKERDQMRENIRPLLYNRIVLFGFTATGRADFYPTPIHSLAPGVVAHGALVNGMITRHFWARVPDYVTHLLTLTLGTLTTILVALSSPLKSAVYALSVIVGYIFLNGLILFNTYDLVVGVAGPLTAMGVSWAIVTLFRFILEIIERNRITARFRSYVDPELVNYIADNPDQASFTGRKQIMTVVFTDLEGFTTLSEKLGEGIVGTLNDYVGAMTPIIRGNRGFIDKFLGDGIMFEFNAVIPNNHHAIDAVTAVLQMQDAMGPFNRNLTERGLPNLKMRVGVNTGPMIFGDAGGAGANNITVLGDAVNLAARLEGANKPFGSAIMVTRETLDQCEGKFAVRPLANVRVKGKDNAVVVYEPLCLAGAETPEQKRLIELTTRIFDLYTAAKFEECMRACDTMNSALGEHVKFADTYHKACVQLLAEGAGPDFDGSISLSEK